MKLSDNCVPYISTLISRCNSKKLKRNKNTESPNCNCIKKEKCPLKGRCRRECLVYKAKVLNPSSNSNYRNDKEVYVCSTQGSVKDITIIKVSSRMIYIDIKQVCPTMYEKSKINVV